MAKWIATITNAGTALLNSQVSGADLVIVGAVSSSTETAAEELAKLTEMTNIKQDLTIGSVAVDSNNSTFSIPVTLFNDNLEVSYALKQIGIYAQDPTNTENKILFAVAQIDVARVINLPADAPGYKLEIDLNFQNTNNSNVVIQVTDESLRSRVDVLEVSVPNKMDKVNPTGNGKFNFGTGNSFTKNPECKYTSMGKIIDQYCDEIDFYSLTYNQNGFSVAGTPYNSSEPAILVSLSYNGENSTTRTMFENFRKKNIPFQINIKNVGYVTTYITRTTTYDWDLIVYLSDTDGLLGNLKNTSVTTSGMFGTMRYEEEIEISGDVSLIFGDNCKANNSYNSLMGYNNIANTSQNIFGFYNGESQGASLFAGQIGNTIFAVGNGTSETSRSNAFRITDRGYLYAKSATVNTGADYAEFFEWADSNVENEDRIGYFVTFDNGKMIRKATKEDDYILGIVSANPCIIGNGDEEWQGRYILDDFGRYILETVDCTESVINSETGEKEEIIVKKVKWKENPDYNSELEYTQRLDRQEWSAIGMMGVLSVRDDGTCQVNGYCTVSDGGIATSCERGVNTYRVLERVTENIVKVLFK